MSLMINLRRNVTVSFRDRNYRKGREERVPFYFSSFSLGCFLFVFAVVVDPPFPYFTPMDHVTGPCALGNRLLVRITDVDVVSIPLLLSH